MKSIIGVGLSLLLITGCGKNVTLEDLTGSYPDDVGQPMEELTSEQQELVGVPDKLPFEEKSVEAHVSKENEQLSEIELIYHGEKTTLSTITVLRDMEIHVNPDRQINMDSGAVASVMTEGETTRIEWYNSTRDVIYQLVYEGKDPDLAQVMETVNSI
ncbi:hypothetical protein [Thalassobacillus sp. CUG 92003]|uniref:hypothetical protein n=1 Tax=Thalassobacillus sp. CUG 92003 TaxID=2736641 RepID=UPI0015E67F09|nr:hypothetical protein [Thalassobacillus sp. CUG 92003]